MTPHTLAGRLTAPILGILVLTLLGCSGNAPLRRFDIQADLADWVYMWNRGEVQTLDGLFTTKPAPTYYAPDSSERLIGIEAITDQHQSQGFRYGSTGSHARMKLEDLHTQYLGNVTVVTGKWILNPQTRGQTMPRHGPLTLVYHRSEDNSWRIVHAHQGIDETTRPLESDMPDANTPAKD